MTGLPMTRRTLLAFVASTAFAASAWGAIRWDELTDEQQQSLLQMARRLYPHDALEDSVYAGILTPLYESVAGNAALAESLHDGLDLLDDATGGDWRSANTDNQIAALKLIETGPFFETVHRVCAQRTLCPS